jgi:hypothetical protein
MPGEYVRNPVSAANSRAWSGFHRRLEQYTARLKAETDQWMVALRIAEVQLD